MKERDQVIMDICGIYEKCSTQAKEYLSKAQKLKYYYEPGVAIIYCWFYSVPQRWHKIEPKIFELASMCRQFDLQFMSEVQIGDLSKKLRPFMFYNSLSVQLKNFCKAIKREFHTWELFERTLIGDSIFDIYRRMKAFKAIRLTFKNLSAMKIFVGGDENLLILDKHVAKILRIGQSQLIKYKTNEYWFKKLLDFSSEINRELRAKLFRDITVAKWSLAIWFHESRISAKDLLPMIDSN